MDRRYPVRIIHECYALRNEDRLGALLLRTQNVPAQCTQDTVIKSGAGKS